MTVMRSKSIFKKRIAEGFTLIELLVVIAIIAILAVVVVLALNPTELLRQARDSNRVSDLSTIKTSVSLYLTDGNTNIASSSSGYAACYLSTPPAVSTTSAKCGGIFTSAAIISNASSSAANYRKTDSTGWVPVNFSAMSLGTTFGSLPVDPTNDSGHFYAYAATSTSLFELGTFIESKKYSTGGSSVVTTGTIYQMGSTLSL